MRKSIDLTNQRFGFWVAIEKRENNKHNQVQWLCKCECGKEKLITANSLRTGNSTSCGCNHSPNLVSEKFGSLLVLSENKTYLTRGRRYWNCQCDCGKILMASTYKLRNNIQNSCGCKENDNGIVLSLLENVINNLLQLKSELFQIK